MGATFLLSASSTNARSVKEGAILQSRQHTPFESFSPLISFVVFECFDTPLTQPQFKPIFEKCCCPSFLLTGNGAYFSILGVVFTDKFAVQRLTDAKWVGEATPHEEGRLRLLARVFYAFRLAIADLDSYYEQVSKDQSIPPLVVDKPHPRFFPYPTRFIEYSPAPNEPQLIDFEYIDVPRIGPTNVSFIVKVKSSDRKLVIKFVERYGLEAHDLLASKGMAPRLLYCGPLDGQADVRSVGNRIQDTTEPGGLYDGTIRMVAMEYIKGSTMDKALLPPGDTPAQIEQALKALHDQQLVFGDLRAPNIMISGSYVYLIDFDWAGKVNEACYPLHLSEKVVWPRDPPELELKPILMEHDLFMLEQLLK